MNDPMNCGACGYAVVGARTCVNGKPSPGWLPMAAPPTPFPSYDYAFAAWTGQHLLVVRTDNTQLEYEPGDDSWLALSGHAPLLLPTNSGGGQPVVTDAIGQRVFVWGDNSGNSAALDVFQDGASPGWSSAGTGGVTPAARRLPAMAYLNGYVYTFFNTGNNIDIGNRYDTSAMAWQSIPADDQFGSLASSYSGRDDSPLVAFGTGLVTFGGQTNTGYLADANVHLLDTGTLTWKTPITGGGANANVIPVVANVLVSTQGRIVSFGGRTTNASPGCVTRQTLVIDPTTGTIAATAPPPLPSPSLSEAYAFDLGRSVMIWGGYSLSCDSGSSDVYSGGSLGVIDPSDDSIDWIAIPADTFQPHAQLGVATQYQGNTQQLWTGREAIVWGGQEVPNGQPAPNVSGSRYQPPVACVCPSDQPICASVSQMVTMHCDPTGQ